MEVIYAIEVASLSRSGLEVLDVKIGKTSNLNSTVAQYRRLQGYELPIKDLWLPNEDLTVSKCEKGVHEIAERYAYERESEKFIFLQDSYQTFSRTVSMLLEPIEEEKARGNKTEQKDKKKNKEISDRRTHESETALEKLENGTEIRHEFKQGEYKGEVVKAKIIDGHVKYGSEELSPSGAAIKAVEDIKGKTTSQNGWRWWKYFDKETEEWRKIDDLRD